MNLRIITVAFIYLFFSKMIAQVNIEDNIVGTTLSIQSKIMNDERELQVFLPDSYKDSKTKYPVLYVLDGHRYFLHAVSLQKSFVEFKQSSEFIIVGISKKQSDRNRNFNVNSQIYRDFLEQEVIKFIDTTYRASQKQMLFGWAFGGGFVIETMIAKPNLFNVYIAASPFPLRDKISKMDSLLIENPDYDKKLYFTSETNEGLVKEGTKELKELLTKKAPKTMNWVFKELEDEEHRSTPFTTLYHAIRYYFKYYPELQFNSLEEFSNSGGLEYVYDYYQKRASQFGFSNELSDWTMFSLIRNAMRANNFEQFNAFMSEFKKTDFISRIRLNRACSIAEFYLKNEQYDNAIELFTLLAEKYPNAMRPLNGLGDTYIALKEEKKATKFYRKAKKISAKN